jgi:hypothetical protein
VSGSKAQFNFWAFFTGVTIREADAASLLSLIISGAYGVEGRCQKLLTQEKIMSVNVNTENVTDATVQVHIAFENAANKGRYQSRNKRTSRTRNNAALRNHRARRLSTGPNEAAHQSSTKKRRFEKRVAPGQQKPLALPAPKPKSPA